MFHLTGRNAPKRTWQTPEKALAKKLFSSSLQNNQLPSMQESRDAIGKYSPLKARTAAQLRTWLNNQKAPSNRIGKLIFFL